MDSILERAANASAQLLRVEGIGLTESAATGALLLTFDLGRVLVAADPDTGELSVLHLENPNDVPEDRSDFCGEEPWWRIIGSPLCGAKPLRGDDDRSGVRLQFRETGDNPRYVQLTARGSKLAVRLETVAAPSADRHETTR